MRHLLIGAIIFTFLATPLYLCNYLVMPQLNALQQTYAHAGDIADRVAAGF